MWYKMNMNVLLIGARGSGKTTVGRALAEQLGWPCIDLDDLALAAFEQQTVRAVWEACGEAAWRAAEVQALQAILSDQPEQDESARGRVIALGGGVPMIPQARKMIEQAAEKGRAVTVYLHTSIDALWQRLSRDGGDRPSLTGADPVEEIASVLAQREPTYRSLADLIVTTDGRSAEEIAAEIVRRLEASTSSA